MAEGHYHANLVLPEDMYKTLKRIANSDGWEVEMEITGIPMSAEADDALRSLVISILRNLRDDNFRKVS